MVDGAGCGDGKRLVGLGRGFLGTSSGVVWCVLLPCLRATALLLRAALAAAVCEAPVLEPMWVVVEGELRWGYSASFDFPCPSFGN